MTFKAFGARCDACQIHRIEQGFRDLGLTESITPDFIFSNDAGTHDEAISYRKDISPNSKLILNVLDIPVHLGNAFDYKKLQQQLLLADIVTTISKFVQNQVKSIYGIDSIVIYQPIMDVYKKYIKFEKLPYKFLHVGRRYDFNKRYSLAVGALQILQVDERIFGNIGSEMVQYGRNLGILTESFLNDHYNSADFVFSLGKIEGLGLSIPESMATGAIPIVCNDLSTLEEFLPKDKFPEYHQIQPHPLSIAKFIADLEINSNKKDELKIRLHEHYKENLLWNFTKIGVTSKIIELA